MLLDARASGVVASNAEKRELGEEGPIALRKRLRVETRDGKFPVFVGRRSSLARLTSRPKSRKHFPNFVGKRSFPFRSLLSFRAPLTSRVAELRSSLSDVAKRPRFVGKRRMFVGKRVDHDVSDALMQPDFASQLSKRPQFIGKRPKFVGKRPKFVGKRSADAEVPLRDVNSARAAVSRNA